MESEDKDSKNNHDNMIDIETVFVCEICTRDFSDRASLWLHIRATHKHLAAFACGVCLKICHNNDQLQNHVNMYHGSKLLMSEQRRYDALAIDILFMCSLTLSLLKRRIHIYALTDPSIKRKARACIHVKQILLAIYIYIYNVENFERTTYGKVENL